MRLYDCDWAPSPRRVRIVLAEKGIAVERIAVDLRRDEQRSAAYLAINPRGTVPALVLNDGMVIDDSFAICRYLEAIAPAPPLFGTTPVEIATVETWLRRIEAEGYAAAVYALRNGHPGFVDRAVPGAGPPSAQIPALVDRATMLWDGFVTALDHRLDARRWIAGETFGMADIAALVTLDFAGRARLTVPATLVHLARWRAAADARPSARA